MRALLLVPFLVALAVSPQAQPASGEPATDDTGWTLERMLQLDNITATALSPEGDLVAYVVRQAHMDGDRSEFGTQIRVAATDGRFDRAFTTGEHSAANPAFSPDGRHLAFTRRQGDHAQVWVLPLAGGEARPVTKAPAAVRGFAWAPDGERVAFTMADPETDEDRARRRERRDVIIVDRDHKYAHLYVVEVADTGEPREAQRLTGGHFHVSDFDWSPDGQTLVFAHQPTPGINDRYHLALATVPADSGAVADLVTWEGIDQDPRFTPDGEYVVFTSYGGTMEAIGLGDLYRVPAAGGPPEPLAHTRDRNVSRIVGFSPDGRDVIFEEAFRTHRYLYRMPLAGGDPQPLSTRDGVHYGASLSLDGHTLAYVYENSDTPNEVYVSATGRIEPRRLTSLHDADSLPAVGRTELLTWTSPDGLEIDGLLTYPVGYRPGQRVPLILSVHGGPAGVYSQSFTGNPGVYGIQYFAENGYAVLRPNPRGSTGYGRDFRYANFQDWGFGDYEDLLAGVDRVIEMGVAHPDSLVLKGWSYGGYMTSFMVTRTDRFKAASMGAGLSNLISMVYTTDIPDYLVAHMGGEIWEEPEVYQRHSAIYRVDQVTTPTQIVHGQQDLRVPLSQGQEFYVALQRRGVPTEMVVYPRTQHGIQEPRFTADAAERILTWFDEHLGRTPTTTASPE